MKEFDPLGEKMPAFFFFPPSLLDEINEKSCIRIGKFLFASEAVLNSRIRHPGQ
jgi:hypothetical protein